jgi:hypothetical protein
MILCDGTGVLIGLIRAPREPVGFGTTVTRLRLRWHANPESAGNRPAVHRRSADDPPFSAAQSAFHMARLLRRLFLLSRTGRLRPNHRTERIF